MPAQFEKETASELHRLIDKYKIKEHILKDEHRVYICFDGCISEDNPYNGYAYLAYDASQTRITLSINMSGLPRGLTAKFIIAVWINELNSCKDKSKVLPITDLPVEEEAELCEYFSNELCTEENKKEFIKDNKRYVYTTKRNIKPLQYFIDRAIEERLITKEETEGITYVWDTRKSEGPIGGSKRTYKIAAINLNYAANPNMPEYATVFLVYVATKLMNMDYILSYWERDGTIVSGLINNCVYGDQAIKKLRIYDWFYPNDMSECLRK